MDRKNENLCVVAVATPVSLMELMHWIGCFSGGEPPAAGLDTACETLGKYKISNS